MYVLQRNPSQWDRFLAWQLASLRPLQLGPLRPGCSGKTEMRNKAHSTGRNAVTSQSLSSEEVLLLHTSSTRLVRESWYYRSLAYFKGQSSLKARVQFQYLKVENKASSSSIFHGMML